MCCAAPLVINISLEQKHCIDQPDSGLLADDWGAIMPRSRRVALHKILRHSSLSGGTASHTLAAANGPPHDWAVPCDHCWKREALKIAADAQQPGGQREWDLYLKACGGLCAHAYCPASAMQPLCMHESFSKRTYAVRHSPAAPWCTQPRVQLRPCRNQDLVTSHMRLQGGLATSFQSSMAKFVSVPKQAKAHMRWLPICIGLAAVLGNHTLFRVGCSN